MRVPKHMGRSLMITGSRVFAGWKRLPLTILLLAVSAVAPVAHAANAEWIVVTNARLIGRDARSKDVSVNLLIVVDKLAIITEDEFVIQAGRPR